MTTERKFTMALSYLRSAYEDMSLVWPSRKSELKRILFLVQSSKFIGPRKCYNISKKF